MIESVRDELENICQVEHTCHGSQAGFVNNLLSWLIAYFYSPGKPSLDLTVTDQAKG